MNKVNISIDDITPHPYASIKVIEHCEKLIKLFPDIKFSLFIPVAYWQTIPRPNIQTNTTAPLKISEHEEFCQALKALPEKNYEICYHGYYHGIPLRSNNDEFQYLNYDQTIEKFNSMFDVVEKAGLADKFKKIFRPPAWRMSPDAIKAAKDAGIDILALSPDDYAVKTYEGEEENFEKVVYYNVNPPFKELQLFDKTEMVFHACEWDKNFLSDEMATSLEEFISSNVDQIEFCFMEGLV
jgi:peptidoglycan/xylan/chitin deacetylase (PgdA/CDA1 family)